MNEIRYPIPTKEETLIHNSETVIPGENYNHFSIDKFINFTNSGKKKIPEMND